MIKSANQVPVYTLLSPENTLVYEVPLYQREYSWARQQWDALFDDLVDAAGPDAAHFLGTIICLNKTSDAASENVLELIDGQQRMTTLSLLLAAIHRKLHDRSDELDEDERTDLNTLRRQLVLKKPVRARLRPQSQNYNCEDYLHVLVAAGIDIPKPSVPNVGNRRIMRAFRHFQVRIDEYATQSGRPEIDVALDVLERVKKAVLVKLEVESYSDAFVLFESLNNRGMALTPIDLIKNTLLQTADQSHGVDMAETFGRWNQLLADLGNDYADQERFFRQYYNAFKATLPDVPNAPVATRSRLIRIYETLIKAGLSEFLDRVLAAGEQYRRILGRRGDEEQHTGFDDALASLIRAQGTPSHILLLFLMLRRDQLELTETHLENITRLLASFFVRRNLTGTPQTYALPKLFMDTIDDIGAARGDAVETTVRHRLHRVSATNELFREKLSGPIYEENVEVARFVLISIADLGVTKENRVDWWEMENKHFKWTIEHILPQGANLPAEWIAMLGSREAAAEVQQAYVHTLGNLTLTGYNATLGNKSFDYKKDRVDTRGNPIGYRNNIRLNDDVVEAQQWTAAEIKERTDRLAEQALELFPI